MLHFSKQVLKEIERETEEIKTKVSILFRALECGANLSMPVSRPMKGYPGLKELRIKDAAGVIRIFYFIHLRDHVFILSSFRKKSQKTPQREIELAISRLRKMKEEFYA